MFPDTLESMKATHSRGMALLWSVEGDVGPAQILAEIGTDAVEVFTRSTELACFIQSQDPEWIPEAPPFPFSANEDGSIEIIENS